MGALILIASVIVAVIAWVSSIDSRRRRRYARTTAGEDAVGRRAWRAAAREANLRYDLEQSGRRSGPMGGNLPGATGADGPGVADGGGQG
ncbi:MAG: hypothetical protein QOF17_1365 [Solirubrobacteraceae bacterium]|nr:hypothetical protein [Solirubrobacteraceae bacterium]